MRRRIAEPAQPVEEALANLSPALSDLPVRKVIRALESVGFGYMRTKGSHAVYRDPKVESP